MQRLKQTFFRQKGRQRLERKLLDNTVVKAIEAARQAAVTVELTRAASLTLQIVKAELQQSYDMLSAHDVALEAGNVIACIFLAFTLLDAQARASWPQEEERNALWNIAVALQNIRDAGEEFRSVSAFSASKARSEARRIRQYRRNMLEALRQLQAHGRHGADLLMNEAALETLSRQLEIEDHRARNAASQSQAGSSTASTNNSPLAAQLETPYKQDTPSASSQRPNDHHRGQGSADFFSGASHNSFMGTSIASSATIIYAHGSTINIFSK